MAAGIKTIYTIRTIPDNMKKLILNALVLSHIHYSATIIQSINQNLILTLDRQLNWAVKASFFREKFDSSRDLKLKHKILPMHYFLKLKRLNYIRKIKTNQLPAFDESRGRELKTWKIYKNERSGNKYWGYKLKSTKLAKSFVRKEQSFPKSLKKAIVIPIFKKADTEDPDNYRPISLTMNIKNF